MMFPRSSGVLCHISSLPSPFAIGDIGPAAYRFVDFLHSAGQRWWQVLPLNPTDRALANSPYSSSSAFAANTLFISPQALVKDGFLAEEDLKGFVVGELDKADYAKAAEVKAALLQKAYENYCSRKAKLRSFEQFCQSEAGWLQDFAMFVVLKRNFNSGSWANWPEGFRDRHPEVLKDFAVSHANEIGREKFFQYLFHRQWMALRKYCLKKRVGIVGDIPIYVNYDSVDVWVNPDIFKLDADRRQTVVAGVPPDYFSADGQRWGNPIYNWDRLRETGFAWWVERLRHNLKLFDLVRVDHFRAFAQCWEIPAEEKTAVRGAWKDVPGAELFKTLQDKFPHLPIIAEDLGIITKDVDALKEKFGFPGMCVLMFAFHNEYKKSRDLPENYKPLSVVYTGTHDNNTLRGWYERDITPLEKKNMLEYFGRELDVNEVPWVMVEMAMKSVASISIVPVQDLLGLGAEARMNRPSTIEGNWLWRFKADDMDKDLIRKLSNLTIQSQR